MCIRVILDHHADVYGIASHPERPFFFASASRDITLRFWRADVLTPDLTMRSIISKDWGKDGVVGNWRDFANPGTRLMMCGSSSKAAASAISLAKDDAARAAIVANFICQPDGLEEVLSLAAAQGSKVPEITNMRVVHGMSLFNVKVQFPLPRSRPCSLLPSISFFLFLSHFSLSSPSLHTKRKRKEQSPALRCISGALTQSHAHGGLVDSIGCCRRLEADEGIPVSEQRSATVLSNAGSNLADLARS